MQLCIFELQLVIMSLSPADRVFILASSYYRLLTFKFVKTVSQVIFRGGGGGGGGIITLLYCLWAAYRFSLILDPLPTTIPVCNNFSHSECVS